MDLKAWQKNWDELGKDDPLWLVLADPSKTGGRWDPEEFFETGRKEIRSTLDKLRELGISVQRDRALDFGCGVGRLTQALAEQFNEVHGVDISPSMVGHAHRFNRFPEKCHYHVHAENRLSMFSDNHFDFVYSNITLQHIEPRFALNYIREFGRVTRPGGAVVFQLLRPTLWRGLIPEFAVEAWRRVKHGRNPYIGMFALPRRKVDHVLEAGGTRIIHVVQSAGHAFRFRCCQYFVIKAC